MRGFFMWLCSNRLCGLQYPKRQQYLVQSARRASRPRRFGHFYVASLQPVLRSCKPLLHVGGQSAQTGDQVAPDLTRRHPEPSRCCPVFRDRFVCEGEGSAPLLLRDILASCAWSSAEPPYRKGSGADPSHLAEKVWGVRRGIGLGVRDGRFEPGRAFRERKKG